MRRTFWLIAGLLTACQGCTSERSAAPSLGSAASGGNAGSGSAIEEVASSAQALAVVPMPNSPKDQFGFTVVRKSADARVFYVSASGNDANDGLVETRPLKTPAVGIQRLRNGYPDWLLFKRGDTFSGGLGNMTLSGRSTSEPMLFSAYGNGARPLFRTGGGAAIDAINSSGAGSQHDHLWFIGLSFYANSRDPADAAFSGNPGVVEGIRWRTGTTDLLIEDCVLRFYGTGATFQNSDNFGISGIRLRRNQFLDSYNLDANGHSQGVYLAGTTGILFEENIFDHNGWNDRVSGAQPTIFNHNLYVDNGNTNVTLQSNIFLRASSHGVQLRPGGIARGNLFVYNAVGLLLGGGTNPEAGGVSGEATDNVVLQGTDIGSTPKQYGIDLSNIRLFVIGRNIIANATTSNAHVALATVSGASYTDNIVYNWPLGQHMGGIYSDPRRDLLSYDRALSGPGTLDHFILNLRAQSQQNWRNQYTPQAITGYIRTGFPLTVTVPAGGAWACALLGSALILAALRTLRRGSAAR